MSECHIYMLMFSKVYEILYWESENKNVYTQFKFQI